MHSFGDFCTVGNVVIYVQVSKETKGQIAQIYIYFYLEVWWNIIVSPEFHNSWVYNN